MVLGFPVTPSVNDSTLRDGTNNSVPHTAPKKSSCLEEIERLK